MQRELRPLILAALICTSSPLAPGFQQAPLYQPDTISCRVLESHTSEHPAVIAIVFHQSNRDDQQRLGTLLEGLPDERVEMQTGSDAWIGVTVARLKSCFGRGLLLLPADVPAPKDGSTFVLKFSHLGGAGR
jgi:hypothetical protein